VESAIFREIIKRYAALPTTPMLRVRGLRAQRDVSATSRSQQLWTE